MIAYTGGFAACVDQCQALVVNGFEGFPRS